MGVTGLVCCFEGDDAADAPSVRALATPTLAGPPEVTRAAARQQARQALAAALAEAIDCDAQDIELSSQRGQPPRARWRASAAPDPRRAAWLASAGLSISHAPGWSLIAWRAHGAVGVDLQTRLAPDDLPAAELQRIATLYLGPDFWSNRPPALVDLSNIAIYNIAFIKLWVAHEARLKCLGEPLQEWSPALQARLAACVAQPLRWAAEPTSPDATAWVAAVARPHTG